MTTIQIRSNTRETIERKFFLDDKLDTFFRFCEGKGFENVHYTLTTKESKKICFPSDKEKTFRELNFSPEVTILVETIQVENGHEIDNDCDMNIDGEALAHDVPGKTKPKAADRNRSVIWYKRTSASSDWKIIPSYSVDLEEAYLKFLNDTETGVVELCFDSCNEHVSVDFGRMRAMSMNDRKNILYQLRRLNLLEDIPISWSWDGKSLAEYHLIPLEQTSSEYIRVSNSVLKTAPCVIEKIERVENPIKYKQYLLLKQKLEILHMGQPEFQIERQLFHGTTEDNIPSICSNGFNRSLCGQHGAVLGAGSYFARDFLYSTSFGTSKIFYADVLTGLYTNGKATMNVAPDFDAVRGIKYDSVVNSVTDPSVFVVFSDNHAYPSYLITYNWGCNGPYYLKQVAPQFPVAAPKTQQKASSSSSTGATTATTASPPVLPSVKSIPTQTVSSAPTNSKN